MQDSWQSGDPYEFYMGRWSKLVAEKFVDWLAPQPGLCWLDLGCGSGALSEAIAAGGQPAELIAIDQSPDFVRTAQRRLGARAKCQVGDAMALPLGNEAVDIAACGLVLNFIPEPERVLAEMRRVMRRHGTVAAYVWDYAGKMDFLTHFWDAAVELDPAAAELHEGRRFPNANAAQLKQTFERSGLAQVEATALDIATRFADFDDYWQPFLGGQGPAPTYVAKLSDAETTRLRDALAQRLPVGDDGAIALSARAWAVRGAVE